MNAMIAAPNRNATIIFPIYRFFAFSKLCHLFSGFILQFWKQISVYIPIIQFHSFFTLHFVIIYCVTIV